MSEAPDAATAAARSGDYGITCGACGGDYFGAVDHFDGGRDYICQTCGWVLVVSADSI